MSKAVKFSILIISSILIAVLYSAGLRFGMVDATKKKGAELDQKVREKKANTGPITLTELGDAITASMLGVPAGTVIADSTAILTDDGKIRIYFFVGGVGQRSAISSDGITFTVEPGVRIAEGGAGHIRVIRLADGRIRLFTGSGVDQGIISYNSSDGLTFTKESGVRISEMDSGLSFLSHLSIVRKPGGGYRGYFSNLTAPGAPLKALLIKSATSSDLFTWSVDSGVRIGPGAPFLTGSAEQVHALQRENDGVTLFYFRNNPMGLVYATSTDGISFSTEYILKSGVEGNGPNIIRRSDGVYLLYYDSGPGSPLRVGKLELKI